MLMSKIHNVQNMYSYDHVKKAKMSVLNKISIQREMF
jgi:hypothetical protein